ncbi:hypothetical protein LTR04_001316 [Oleoguttula sp. CCFEE 6159]|nr:hypothetical protein LTR04_001316 [Oleoguttula sp. CCFEE 6159]
MFSETLNRMTANCSRDVAQACSELRRPLSLVADARAENPYANSSSVEDGLVNLQRMSAQIARDAEDVSRAFFQLEAARSSLKDTTGEQNAALAPSTDDLGKIMHSITGRAKDIAEGFKSSPAQSIEAMRPTDLRTSSRTATRIHPPASKVLDNIQLKAVSTLADLRRKRSRPKHRKVEGACFISANEHCVGGPSKSSTESCIDDSHVKSSFESYAESSTEPSVWSSTESSVEFSTASLNHEWPHSRPSKKTKKPEGRRQSYASATDKRQRSVEAPADTKKTTQRTANETDLSEFIIEINGDYSKMKKVGFDGIFNILNYPENATTALELERQYYERYLRIREDDLRVDEEQREAYRLAIEEEMEQGFGMELRRMKKEHDQSMVNAQQVLNVQMENSRLRGEIASLKEGLLPVFCVDYTHHGLDFHHHVVDGVFHSLEEANDKARSSFEMGVVDLSPTDEDRSRDRMVQTYAHVTGTGELVDLRARTFKNETLRVHVQELRQHKRNPHEKTSRFYERKVLVHKVRSKKTGGKSDEAGSSSERSQERYQSIDMSLGEDEASNTESSS